MNRRETLRHLLFISLLALLYCVLWVWEPLKPFTQPSEFCAAIVYFFALLLLLFLLSQTRNLWAFSWLLLCISSSFARHIMASYGLEINKEVITVFFLATSREIDSTLDIYTVWAIIKGIFIGLLGIWFLSKSGYKGRLRIAVGGMAAYISIGIILLTSTSARPHAVPYNYLAASFDYWQSMREFNALQRQRIDISKDAGYIETHTSKPLVIVLVIGESARADHFSINGYERKTNPFLEKTSNLINFPKATSCGVMTSVSVPCMLTRATKANKEPMKKETSVISVFKKLGFETAWFGAQGSLPAYDPVSFISREAKEFVVLMPSHDGRLPYDEELLPYLDNQLKKNSNSFIIIHTIGSHIQYSDRYTPAFEKFKPVCAARNSSFFGQIMHMRWPIKNPQDEHDPPSNYLKNCFDEGGLINDYDNTILYTDYFIHEVIERLKGQESLVIYLSDHGESLGENGHFMHLHPDDFSNWHIPMIWWASDSFIKDNNIAWKYLLSNANNSVSQDNLFHSLLDCSGVHSILVDKSLSLCEPSVQK